MKHMVINKYISIIKRCSNSFFDKKLAEYGIGSGQQFFLLHIASCPGTSFQELAVTGGFDKATSTRAVKKLIEEGYVYQEIDEEDRRVRHLYVTEKAGPVLARTWEILEDWIDLLTKGFGEEEISQAECLLERMVSNAWLGATEKYRHQGE